MKGRSILKDKTKRIELRVTQSEKEKIAKFAESCGLSQSEYIRQRALGYAPRAVLPDVFLISMRFSVGFVMRLQIRFHLRLKIVYLMSPAIFKESCYCLKSPQLNKSVRRWRYGNNRLLAHQGTVERCNQLRREPPIKLPTGNILTRI